MRILVLYYVVCRLVEITPILQQQLVHKLL